MKRRKPIDPQGHREVKSQAVVKCEACYDVRREDQQWSHPCSRRDKPWPQKYRGED